MSISHEAVEAAARELWPGGTIEQHRLRQVRKALEAAAPHMAAEAQAQAWDAGNYEGYKQRAAEGNAAGRSGEHTISTNPHRTTTL